MVESVVGLMDPANRMETWDEEEDRVVSQFLMLGWVTAPFTCVYIPTRKHP